MEFNWRDTRVPPAECPYCQTKHDGASSPEGYTPEPGHYSICNRCASFLKFGDNMELLPVLRDEVNMLENENPDFMDMIRKMQMAVRAIDRRKKEEIKQ